MPETIFVLAVEQGLAHEQEVLAQLLILLAFGRQQTHRAYQCSIHPAIAAAPIAVLAVLFLVGCHVVGIAPPEAFLHVQTSAATLVATPAVALHGIVQIVLVVGYRVHLYKYGHGHLNGVNPGPVVGATCGHLLLQILLGGLQRTFSRQQIQLDVGLRAALVVGMRRSRAVARCPLVEVSPAQGIVDVALLRVDGVESHQSLVVDGTRPQRTGTDALHVGGNRGVTILRHEVVVGQPGRLQDVRLRPCGAKYKI